MFIKISKSELYINLNLDIRNKNTYIHDPLIQYFCSENYVIGGMYMGRNYSNKNLTNLELGNIRTFKFTSYSN